VDILRCLRRIKSVGFPSWTLASFVVMTFLIVRLILVSFAVIDFRKVLNTKDAKGREGNELENA
jgi:hypothetical protein